MNSIYDSCEAYLPIILQTFIQDIEEAAAKIGRASCRERVLRLV